MLAVCALMCFGLASAAEWSIGATRVESTAMPGDAPDLLKVTGPWGSRSQAFSRSRGPVDVLRGSHDGSVRLPDLVLDRDARQIKRLVTSPWTPLDASTDLASEAQRATVTRDAQRCQVVFPRGWAAEATGLGQLPRSAAGTADRVLLLLESPAQSQRLPMVVDLRDCRVRTGPRLRSPGFDLLLQGQAGVWWLTSNQEGVLMLSRDGLHWQRRALPMATHALLSAYVANGSTFWVAVSQAQADFQTRVYRWHEAKRQWQPAAPADTPAEWLELKSLLVHWP